MLERISSSLKREKKPIASLSDEERRKLVSETLGNISADYADTILKDSGRNEFLIRRMEDLADRTLWAVGKQLEKGVFAPDVFEMPFIIDEHEIRSGENTGRMVIKGKIDRIDICEDDDNVYVRIVDYKSGKSDFDLLKAYYGIKMQLVVYMRAAMQIEKKRHPDKNIIPAGLLYYNIDNPIVELDSTASDLPDDGTSVEKMIFEALAMKGVVNCDGNIIKNMDSSDVKKSDVIPVSYKKDGTIDSRSHILNTDQFISLDNYIAKKTSDVGKKIYSGADKINPYKDGNYSSCSYCPYNEVCGFSQNLGNIKFRQIQKFDDAQLWENIKEGVDEDGSKLD